jgi:H+-transporting ATPase
VSSTNLVAPASERPHVEPAHNDTSAGLTSEETRARLENDGHNAIPDTSVHPLRNALPKFWAPVP